MSYTARHAGTVKQGQLVLADPASWRAAVARHEGRDVFVTVVRQQHLRTMPQNRYYHGVVVDSIAGFIGESREETHELLKAQFLPKRSIELLDGRGLEMPPSTRLLSVEEFAAYIERVRVWAAQFLSLSIPDANQVEVSL
jgi:hypothetical protein